MIPKRTNEELEKAANTNRLGHVLFFFTGLFLVMLGAIKLIIAMFGLAVLIVSLFYYVAMEAAVIRLEIREK